jgi:glycosyltransferase involved in cell wall biosynthesis
MSKRWNTGAAKPGRRPVVALVTDAIYPYHCGGKELRYHELIDQLADRAELHVYTMNWWHGPRVRYAENATFHALTRYHPLYSGRRRSIRQSVFFAFGCLRLLTCRFDVLEADHMPYVQIPILRLVATLRRKRFVVTWHELWGKEYWQQYLGRIGLAAWLMEWLTVRLPDEIIAASTQTADRIRAATDDRVQVTVAPNGIDLQGIHNSYPIGEPTDVVVVSRLIEHKRIDMLLAAVARLHAAGQPVTCRIIGDGPEKAALHAQTEQLGLLHAIEFRHDVRDQKELYGLIKSGRLFVFPSAREGFGIAVLEAIACGLPVITTSAADNLARHLVAQSSSGIVCDPSATALAQAMQRLLTEPNCRSEEDRDGGSWLAQYDWRATAVTVAKALLI